MISDGDTLDCFVDLNVHGDFNFTGEETVHAFTVAPPYNDFQLQHRWDVARSYSPNVFCTDGRGGKVNRFRRRIDQHRIGKPCADGLARQTILVCLRARDHATVPRARHG